MTSRKSVADASLGESSYEPVASQQRLRPMLGTLCAVQANGSAQAVESGLLQAFAAMHRVDQIMHPTRSGSDLLRMSRAVGQSVQIDAETWQVLHCAQRIHAASGGVFDPCLATQPGSLRDIELLPDARVVCHAPVAVDLGGIAKGHAIDLAINALLNAGCSSGLVNMGGDVRVFGAKAQSIMIRIDTEQSITVELSNAALAVSALHNANHPDEHRGYYLRGSEHQPIYSHVAVMVEQAIIADALTKCLMFCSDADSNALLAKFNAKRVLPFVAV